MPTKPDIQYFISYAHNDNAFFQVFKKGIATHLRNSGKYSFKAWDDAEIPVGSSWHEEIQTNLARSKMAILCVSGNFLNSSYIRTSEFEVLIKQFQGVKIIPVYFSACDFTGWKDLAEIQFFKPDGSRYDESGTEDFSYCDLVKFNSDSQPVPNANLEKYYKDFVQRVEMTLDGVNTSTTANANAVVQENTGSQPGDKKAGDALVSTIFISVMAISAAFVLFCLLFQKMNTEGMFKSSLGSVMFFFSGAFLLKNKKTVTA